MATAPVTTADVPASTVYGATAVATCMTAYKTRFTEAGFAPQEKGGATAVVVQCKVGNLAAGALVSTLTAAATTAVPTIVYKCGKQDLDNGLVRFQDDNLITCTGATPGTGTAPVLKGASKCFYYGGAWSDRSRMLSADMRKFRSVGKKVVAGTAEGDINDTDIKCFNKDKNAVLTGAANCWAYEITSQKLFAQPQYLWLAQPTCNTAAAPTVVIAGDKCKQTNVPNVANVCNAFTKMWTAQTCTPNFTWVPK